MIYSIHCVRRFAPALPLRGTSLREDGLHEATHAVLTDHNSQPISTVWTSIQNPSKLHLNIHCDLSKVQGRLKLLGIVGLTSFQRSLARTYAAPALSDFAIAPLRETIRTILQHQVQVIRHDRISKHFDPEQSTQVPRTVTHPGAAVLIIASTVCILSTEKGPPNAARYAVIHANFIRHNNDSTGLRHTNEH